MSIPKKPNLEEEKTENEPNPRNRVATPSFPSLINRFTAVVIDMVIAVTLIVGLVFGAGLVLKGNKDYSKMEAEIRTEFLSSQLRPTMPSGVNFVSRALEASEFMGRTFPVENNQMEFASTRPRNDSGVDSALYSDYRIIQSLAYFYCSYMAGNENAIRQNDIRDDGTIAGTEYVLSELANEQVLYKSQLITPADYFTVEWFNRNILEVNPSAPAGEKGNRYFTIEKEDGSLDWNSVATPKYSLFIDDDWFVSPDATLPLSQQEVDEFTNYSLGMTYFGDFDQDLQMFFASKYSDAASFFYSLDYISTLDAEMAKMESFVAWTAVSIVALILFLVIPLCMKKGQTIGRLLFKIGVVNRNTGFFVKKWQTLLRFAPYILVLVLGFVLANDLVVIGILLGLYLIDMIMVILSKDNKLSISDYISNTALADYGVRAIHKNHVDEVEYLKKKQSEDDHVVVQPKINPEYDSRQNNGK